MHWVLSFAVLGTMAVLWISPGVAGSSLSQGREGREPPGQAQGGPPDTQGNPQRNLTQQPPGGPSGTQGNPQRNLTQQPLGGPPDTHGNPNRTATPTPTAGNSPTPGGPSLTPTVRGPGGRGQSVLVCHVTGSESNPFVLIEVNEQAVAAHAEHGDIIGVSSEDDCAQAGTPTVTPQATVTGTPPTATPTPAGVATATPTATPIGGTGEDRRVLICHQTGSETNPFVLIEVDQSAVAAHLAHGDIADVEPDADCSELSTNGTPTPSPTPTPVTGRDPRAAPAYVNASARR